MVRCFLELNALIGNERSSYKVGENSILQKYFLSVPKEYPLYLVGLFDFHDGPTCQTFRDSDISLPMAFVHTVC